MYMRWLGAGLAVLSAATGVQAQQFGPDLHLPLAGLNKVAPGLGGASFLPPLPGQPLGAFMPPPGTNFQTGAFNSTMNQFGAMTPWPFQNPFTPSHWNFAGFNNYNNPYQAGGLWAGPPFGQYGYGGYGNFAPIVGINNGWFPYEAPWNNNGFGMPGMQGWGGQGWGAPGWGMGMGGNPFMPNNLMFQRVP